MSDRLSKEWFLSIRYNERAPLNIICFPCGGGSASSFWSWKDLPVDANIWALKLPGRESRIAETPITRSNELVSHLVNVLPSTFPTPFVFYGHSMGAGIAFETMLELHKRKRDLPDLFIACGRESPQSAYRFSVENMDDHSLIEYMQTLGGIPQSLPSNKAFMGQYIPKIRADYLLNASIPTREAVSLPVLIHLMNGKNDPLVQLEKLVDWSCYTAYPLSSCYLPGGHFFMEECREEYLNEIADVLMHC